MHFVADLEADLMSYCLEAKGKWWATHLYRNSEVDDLYRHIRAMKLGDVLAILDKEEPTTRAEKGEGK